MIPKSQVTRQLLDLGVQPGGVLLVHCAFSQVKPVEDGPEGLIAALRSALGPEGTLVMPSMTADDDHPFDPRHFLHRHGHRRPDLLAAAGRTAQRQPARLRRGWPAGCPYHRPAPRVDVPHGLDSPVGRVYELDGQVLLLGVDHTANTYHPPGQYMRRARYRRKKYVTLLKEGRLSRFDYTEIDHCCQNFSLVDGWLESEGLPRRETVGRGQALVDRAM